ncbi:siderophore-interacting protein [Rarobacter incanus]|uniref:NADPH-dependent ferric siderophore reductase n=1 Tax=Rarobacter incanus TaxID=153494 RepID=A0A542SNA8_9MICO|nr:siderophore-interacting protein [Rarobacter incanus]TQK75985.1 NADPH-dependent ferric siderophore reductase [Rarobacter incanus]
MAETLNLGSAPAGFRFERRPAEMRRRLVTLSERTLIARDCVRVRVAGSDLRGFGANSGIDDHVRIFFPGDAASASDPGDWPSREYTPVAWADDWLDLEFVLHGSGVASEWAGAAPIGSQVVLGGPRGSVHFSGNPAQWLIAGDESAVAQIRRYAAAMPPGADARIVIEVADSNHEVPVEAPCAITYVHRGTRPPGDALVAALRETSPLPRAESFAFVAGEQSVVSPARNLVFDDWGLSDTQAIVKGYWRRA